jgi:hypothetical protein
MKGCDSDGDCRDGYVCRQTAHMDSSGMLVDLGAELLPNAQGQVGQAKFCIERPVGGPPGPNVDAPPLPDAGPADAPASDGSPTD